MRKVNVKTFILSLLIVSGCIGVSAQTAAEAREIIRAADENMEGQSSKSVMSMSIIRPSWERTLEFKNWVKGDEYALTLVTAPAKEKGQTFLKRGNDMWNYLPNINRLVKLPPSMMSQGWMGSDYTNDDVLNETSLSDDFDHSILGEANLENRVAWIIEMIPKVESSVVWGKVKAWVSKKDTLFLKMEYYDEDGYLIRTEKFSAIKTMDGRTIPTRYEIIPADEPDQKTVVVIHDMQFDIDLKDSFFSQQNMKRIR